jgi:adenosylmethionine-8-amino-7-oxononanoate aminotransferase
MPTPEELADWDQAHYWHAFTQMAEYKSVVIERAEGAWLVDTAGNRYLDGFGSMWCNLLGHRHPAIDEAIRKQLDHVAHATSLGMATPPAVELARRLAELAPGDLSHIFFSSDGSSAVEAAVKIAFQYWRQCETPKPEKTRFVALGEAYHGDTIGSVSLGGIDRFSAIFSPLLFEVLRLPVPDARKLPPEAGAEHFLADLEILLEEHHAKIAAMVLEPRIQAAAGMVFHPPGYLRGVRELTRKYKVLLIADEVVTGCGRLGSLFACDLEGVVPDLMCLGKSLTGGYLPLSATIATPDIYRAFLGSYESGRSFRHGHTYSGNPLAAAAALATLNVVTSSDFQARLLQLTEQMRRILAELSHLPQVLATRQEGMIAAIDLGPSDGTHGAYAPSLRFGQRVCNEARQRGVWLRPLGDTLILIPPLCVSDEELGLLGRVLAESIAAAAESLTAQRH